MRIGPGWGSAGERHPGATVAIELRLGGVSEPMHPHYETCLFRAHLLFLAIPLCLFHEGTPPDYRPRNAVTPASLHGKYCVRSRHEGPRWSENGRPCSPSALPPVFLGNFHGDARHQERIVVLAARNRPASGLREAVWLQRFPYWMEPSRSTLAASTVLEQMAQMVETILDVPQLLKSP